HHRPFRPRARVAVPHHVAHFRAFEDGRVEVHRLLGLAVEPQERRYLLHAISFRYDCSSQLTIHGMPKRSTSIPNRGDQNVFSIGIVIVPFSASALNTRSASSGVFTCSATENPEGFAYCPGGESEAITIVLPMSSRACMILLPHSAGTCVSAGVPLCVIIATI